MGLRYDGADAGSFIANYDVRYRKAAWDGRFAPYVYPASSPDWAKITATAVTLPAAKGNTYCLSVRSRDEAGNTSDWSADRCTAVALDDRSLVPSSEWTRDTGTKYYARTVTKTTVKGATLTRTAVQANRIALVATTCPDCGTVAVHFNGELLQRISLDATTTAHKKIIPVDKFGAMKTGTVTIRTLNVGSTRIDGLAINRT